jgi:tRNA nucleotidyltransferase (CCA-adding enzyme)
MVMLRRPARQEIDLAVEGDAVRWGHAIAESFGVPVGRVSEFNTCKIDVMHEGVLVRLDVASCRTDAYPVPGGMPVVSPASLYEDLYRRDFSVNAMAFPLEFPLQRSLLLLDPVGGREDIARKELRILSSKSFEEDPVRVFRLFRFQERLGFRPAPLTTEALETSRVNEYFMRASKSRLWDEIQNSIGEDARCAIVFRWLTERPWGKALPSLGMSSPRRARVFTWDRLSIYEKYFSSMGRFWKEILLFLAIFYGLPRKECDRGLRLFGIPEKKAKVIRETLFSERSGDAKNKKVRPEIQKNLSPQRNFLELVRAESGAPEFWEKAIVNPETRSADESFLKGDDLVREGIAPSPELGDILAEIRRLRRKGVLNSRDEELEWVRDRKRTAEEK